MREFDTRTENAILTGDLAALSPDGQTLAFAHTSQMSLWDVATGLFRVISLDEEFGIYTRRSFFCRWQIDPQHYQQKELW